MKTSFSGLTLQSKTLSSFPNRKRIFSLKNVIRKVTTQADDDNEKKVLLKLERALDKDNQQYSQHIAESQSKIPGFEQLAIDHKLWRYFQSRMKTVKNKVQRQQVNCCQRQFTEIKKLVSRRRDAHKFSLTSTQRLIKDKYKQITELFDQIKQQKIIKLNKTTTLMLPFAYTQKLTLFKENIENIRFELGQLENQMKLEQQEEEKLVKEWISLLVHIVKEGFVMEDGVRSVLREMGRVQYVPAKKDFPGFIDQTTFKCFMRIYQDIKKEQVATRQTEKQGRRRQVSSSIKNIRQIAKRADLKKIYEGTREYMLDWLKNESWKESCTLPKIKQKVQISNNNDWQEQQRKRMKIVYEDKEKLKIIKTMLFGPKVQIIQ